MTSIPSKGTEGEKTDVNEIIRCGAIHSKASGGLGAKGEAGVCRRGNQAVRSEPVAVLSPVCPPSSQDPIQQALIHSKEGSHSKFQF